VLDHVVRIYKLIECSSIAGGGGGGGEGGDGICIIRQMGIAQLFHSNKQTVWPHLQGSASARGTRRKVGFEPATIHLPALRHIPPHYDGPRI
jgi:hypothetical protein